MDSSVAHRSPGDRYASVRDLRELICNQLRAALWECCSTRVASLIEQRGGLERATAEAIEDARAFATKDPAAHGDVALVVRAYTSFKVVLHYRLAHALLNGRSLDAGEASLNAGFISSRGKLLSGAEIHPACVIGKRFILDHGMGTVIGETTEIGDDCYVLGGVTLGADGIAGNPNGKRHPTIGHRVQIGASVRIFGPVHVGDDVFIGPHCVITRDVPAGSVVTVRATQQVVRGRPAQGNGRLRP